MQIAHSGVPNRSNVAFTLVTKKKKNVIELYFKNMRDKEGGKKEMGYNKSAKMQMEADNETGT